MNKIRTLALNGAASVRLVVLPAIWLSLFAYAGRPIVFAAETNGLSRGLSWGAIAVLALLPLLPAFVRRTDALASRSAAHWIGYATLGVFSLLLVLGIAGDFARALFYVARAFPAAALLPVLNRGAMSFAILGAAGALSLVGLFQARCPRIQRVSVTIDDLPQELDGYSIVQWSDVHVGPTIRRRFVQALVEKTNAIGADAVVITGDLVDGYLEELRDELAPMAGVRARDGIYYVTGNHEYYWRASEWVAEVQRLGAIFLKNEHRVIERGAAKLVIAGVTDPVGRYTHKQDPIAALDGAPLDAVKVLLSHRPQTADVAEKLGVHLQLSGHTHGGQFFPFNYAIRLFQPVVAGLHRVGTMWLYVSRGTGYWGPPSRLGVHGEITHIELRRA